MESQEKKNRRSEEVGHGVPWGEHSHHGAASILEMFTDAILSSLKSLGIICGYIVLFTMFTDFLVYSGLLSGMSEVGVAVVKGIFEMTVGCGSIAEVGGLSLTVICAISSFFISFGGISIMAQSMSMMSGLGISTFSYVKAKLTHGIFALVIAFIAGPSFLSGAALETALLNGPVSGTAMPYESFNMMAGLDGIYCLFFSAKMVIMLVIVMLSILAAEGMIGRKKYKRSQE